MPFFDVIDDTTLADAVAANTEAIDTLEGSISTLSGTVSANTTAISALSTTHATDKSNLEKFLHINPIVIDTITRDRAVVVTSAAVNGTVEFTYFTPLNQVTVSQLTMITSTSLGTGTTGARIGLYRVDGEALTLVARTAMDSTLFKAAFTKWTRNFDTTGGYPATYTLVPGQRYAVGFIVLGSGVMPTFYISGYGLSSLMATAPRLCSIVTGQSDIPTTFTPTTLPNNTNRMHYVGLA